MPNNIILDNFFMKFFFGSKIIQLKRSALEVVSYG